MVVLAILLIALGVITSLLGTKLFKLLLPLLGLVTGFMVGYLGFQGVFGTGAVSVAMSIVIALVIGLLLAISSYVFFDIAVVFYSVAIGATAGSYLGVALGLREEGFIVLLLAITGGILAGVLALSYNLGVPLVLAVTSMLGTAYILTGLLLIVGEVSTSEISDNGVVATLTRVVDQSLLWLFVWIGGSLISLQLQTRLLLTGYGSSTFEYQENKRK